MADPALLSRANSLALLAARLANPRCPNLTADHRVIYGADAAAFLKDLAELIETRPESLAL